MKLNNLFIAATLSLSLIGGSALAETDKVAKQAEIRKVAQESIERFYKADPKLEAAVTKAPGYAVFTTYGLSFLVGGAGGKGLAHDNTTQKDTFMSMAKGSAGAQIGISESETLIIFHSAKTMKKFVDSGWTFGAGGAAQAGAGGKSAGKSGGGMYETSYYTLTKNGLDVGLAAEGAKFWKDKELN
jgi:lipid-binding SYLF domain-containing protein